MTLQWRQSHNNNFVYSIAVGVLEYAKKNGKCYVPSFYVANSLPFIDIYQMVSPWLGEIKKKYKRENVLKKFFKWEIRLLNAMLLITTILYWY